MNDEQFKNNPWFQELHKYYQEAIPKAQDPTTDNLQIATPQTTELTKSPSPLQTKKDPQSPYLVRRLPHHLQFEKFMMEEKAKTMIIENEEEDEDLPTYVEEELPEEDPIQPIWWPKYVPPSKEKAKVPTNLDEVNSVIVTLSLPKAMPVEN